MTMMPANAAQPNSALSLLFGPAGGVTGLTQAVSSSSAGDLSRIIPALPAELREPAAKEVSRVAAGLLDVDLIGLLVEGWREYADLTSAARRTLATAGSSELVSLVTHRVTAEQDSNVDLLVDGRPVAVVRFGLSVEFAVSGMVAGVSAGLLVAVHAGRCDMTATLAINGSEVLTRQARLELPGVIAVTPGVRLLPAQDYAVAAAVVSGTPAGPNSDWWVAAAASGSLAEALPATAASAVSPLLSPAAATSEESSAAARRRDPGRKWWQR